MNGTQDLHGRKYYRRKNKRNKPKDEMDDNRGVRPPQAETGSKANQVTVKQKQERKEPTVVKENDLKDLPVPVPLHLAALTKLLNTIFKNYGMSNHDIEERNTIFQEFRELAQKEIPDCTIQLYGSSHSFLGLNSSDVNIDVHHDEEGNIPRIFMTILNILKNSGEKYSDIKEEFEAKRPTIHFTVFKSGLTCRISTENNSSILTSTLLKIYGELDYRVRPLCVGFKLWAKICKVDCQAAGTLPSYSFVLMVIHFLQQTNPPVLPVIHEKLADITIEKCISKHNSSEEILKKIRGKFETMNTGCLGSLWLELLRYYVSEETLPDIIINVTQGKPLLRNERKWGKKNRFAIEDPFSTKRNVARNTKGIAFRYTNDHLKFALRYFGRFPASKRKLSDKGEHNEEIPYKEHKENDADETLGENDDGAEVDQDLVDGIFAMDTINDSVISNDRSSDVDNENDDNTDTCTDQSFIENKSEDIVKPPQNNKCLPNSNSAPEDMARQNVVSSEPPDLDWKNVQFLFDDSVLRKGPPFETKCSSCGEDGHIVDNCIIEKKEVLKNLPMMTNWFKEILTAVCVCCKDDFGMSMDEVKNRQRNLKALETLIRLHYPDARLHLFGSSCNGFGFHDSDLDICMMFEGKMKNDIDCISTITSLSKILRGSQECGDVIAITGAKVPIVKFYFKRAKHEADISLYNEVALWNTKLLATYAAIDNRVHILGCTLKIFVKLCEIGDASRGSLSSYAYTLMLIHFLQQCDPPVLPVLQELYNTKEKPERIVEGFNCWFYDDPEKLGSKWKAENTESCGELWLGFLRYFTETFDYHRHVVCIRSRKPLTKFEKLWNGKKICIEDPFVLTHNLGAGLSPTMAKFILSAFENARERFGTPRRDLPLSIQHRQRFFFDPMFLNNGSMPPTGRNCSICRRIGHWAKECPYNRANRGQEGKKSRKKTQNDKDDKIERKKEGDSLKDEQSQTPLKRDEQTDISQENNNIVSSTLTTPDSHAKVVPPQQNMITSTPPFGQLSPPQMAVLLPSSPPQNPGAPTSPLSPNMPGHLSSPGRTRPQLAPFFAQSHLPGGVMPPTRNRFHTTPPRTSTPNQFSNFPNPMSFRHQINPPPPRPLMAVSPKPIRRAQFGDIGQRAWTSNDFITSLSPDQHSVSPQPRFHGRYAELIPGPMTPNYSVSALSPNQAPVAFSPQPAYRFRNPELTQRPTAPANFLNSSPPRQHSESSDAMTRARFDELTPGSMKSNDLIKKTPHSQVITCEALENRGMFADAFGRDQADGGSHASSDTIVEHEGFSLSVLQSLNISDNAFDQGQHVKPEPGNKQGYLNTQETSGTGDIQGPFEERRGTKDTPGRIVFTPPNNILAKELNDTSLNSTLSWKNRESEYENASARTKDSVVNSHGESENSVRKLPDEKTEELAVLHNSRMEGDGIKTTGSENRNKRRRYRKRGKMYTGDIKNETPEVVQQKDSNTTGGHTEKQKEDKNSRTQIPTTKMKDSEATKLVGHHSGGEKEANKVSANSGHQVKVGDTKEKKDQTSRQTNTRYEDSKPQNVNAPAKHAGESLIIKVNGLNERKVVVDSRKDSNAIGVDTQLNKRRRSRSRKKNKSDKPEDTARRDDTARGGRPRYTSA